MNKVLITAIRQTIYHDLMEKYENPIEHTCDVLEGQQWISVDGKCPEGLCPSAKSSKSWKNPIDFSKIKTWWNGLASKLKLAWTYMPENKKLAYKILGLIMVAMILTSISPKLATLGFLLVVGYLFWVIIKK